MKRVLPILASIVLVAIFGGFAYFYLQEPQSKLNSFEGEFERSLSCKRKPLFLAGKGAVYIDLSQQRYRGIAFLFGRGFRRVLHSKEWERFGYFGTYTLDSRGNLYLTPTPFISIEKDTFENQKWIYKLDSKTKKLTKWLELKDVKATDKNPYGVISIDYDCDDKALWVSAIDKSDYERKRGRVYKIDLKSKKILAEYEGVDFLTIKLIKTSKAKYLLGGSAREGALYAWKIIDGKLDGKPFKLFELPDYNLRIRKIHISSKNSLKIEAINFSYSLIAQTSNIYRHLFLAFWDKKNSNWILKRVEK